MTKRRAEWAAGAVGVNAPENTEAGRGCRNKGWGSHKLG